MANLTDEQIESASNEWRSHLRLDVNMRLIAPYLQLPWDRPTEDEVLQANTRGSSYKLVPQGAARCLIERFVHERNDALLPKPVDPRRAVVLAILDRVNRREIAPSNAVDDLLAALDQVK